MCPPICDLRAGFFNWIEDIALFRALPSHADTSASGGSVLGFKQEWAGQDIKQTASVIAGEDTIITAGDLRKFFKSSGLSRPEIGQKYISNFDRLAKDLRSKDLKDDAIIATIDNNDNDSFHGIKISLNDCISACGF